MQSNLYRRSVWFAISFPKTQPKAAPAPNDNIAPAKAPAKDHNVRQHRININPQIIKVHN